MKDIILVAGCALALAGPVLATTHHVTADGLGDFPTIQDAVTSAADGDTIELGAGLYTGNGNRDVDYLGKQLVIRSAGGDPELCILDVQGSAAEPHCGFWFITGEDSASVLEGITVRNGYRPVGAAVYMSSAAPTFKSCVFDSNTAETDGGAVHCDVSSPSFDGCSFRDNSAGDEGGAVYVSGLTQAIRLTGCEFLRNQAAASGGGLFASSSVEVTLQDCLFQDNNGGIKGGGVYVHFECDIDFSGCDFVGNAAWEGGGFHSQTGWGPLADCAFEDNEAISGGGIYFDFHAASDLTNCLFVGNIASDKGGGIYFHEGTGVQPINCTFAGNSALGKAAGSAIWGNTTGLSLIRNCIIAFNGGGQPLDTNTWLYCTDIYGNDGGDWVGSVGWQADLRDNFSADPRFCGDYAPEEPYTLLSNSPCAAENNPACGLVGALPVGCIAISDVGPPPASTPAALLLSCYPNPFNPQTAIRFALSRPQTVQLAVYSLDGRLINVLADAPWPAGEHAVVWDGRDRDGRFAASGVFFCRLKAGDYSETIRAVLLK